MKRTISAMVGKGSVNHNSRKFKAENVDGSRTYLNIDYCNENIKKVYHELFNDALKKYNDKQTRADRKIENYYEKIRNSKQEKPFHELILQIGDKENMSAESENGELARQILDEYYRGFQERNPQLQGFKGGTRGDTEWNQWVSAEKSALAFVMERHGIEWEHKGTHEKHLSVLDYKKQERVKELNVLEYKLAEKKDEFQTVQSRIQNYDNGTQVIEELDKRIETDSEFQLPDPPALMSAKSYKQKFVDPLVKKLKEVIKEVFYRYYHALDSYHRLNNTNASLYRENERLIKINDRLTDENTTLRTENRDFRLLRKVFGSQQIDALISQAKEQEQQRKHTKQPSNQRTKRIRNNDFER